MSTIFLYINTIKSMKLSQIYYRIRKKFNIKSSIGCNVTDCVCVSGAIPMVKELDFDPIFLNRFSVEKLMNNRITLLHSTESFNWNTKWVFDNKSALWNFNLHYFEYIFPLINEYLNSGDYKYINKTMEMIDGWIIQNPIEKGGVGWSPYTIDLRITNWISYYSVVEKLLDENFRKRFLKSIHEQYVYLSNHLEKDILGNHYFEDLKTLILCALFFDDNSTLEVVIKEFVKECREEILGDGMHFELSPMYHKLIFEGIIKVSSALRSRNKTNSEIESYIQPMLDVAWSLEEGLHRLPLFNDSGNNITKSLEALVNACKNCFDIIPNYKSFFKISGFYIFKKNQWKMIVDAGQPGPSYIPGHSHCDALSFELYRNGKPVISNCGTYAYQCKQRGFFRSTAAHNTVMINDLEQSQCWGVFRLAKRSTVNVCYVNSDGIKMELTDFKGNKVYRTIQIGDSIEITDETKDGCLSAYLHFIENIQVVTTGNEVVLEQDYSPEYGLLQKVTTLKYTGKEKLKAWIELK